MNIDHVHFYVEDARASRNWFVRQLGFQAVAATFSSFHTCTEVVKSGSVYLVLSSPLTPLSPVAQFLTQHPAGVTDIAFCVEDLEAVMTKASAHGAKILQPIQQHQQGKECLKWGKIAAWGSLTHTLIERRRDGEIKCRGAQVPGSSSAGENLDLFSPLPLCPSAPLPLCPSAPLPLYRH